MEWPFFREVWHGICMPGQGGVVSTQRATAGAVALPGRAPRAQRAEGAGRRDKGTEGPFDSAQGRLLRASVGGRAVSSPFRIPSSALGAASSLPLKRVAENPGNRYVSPEFRSWPRKSPRFLLAGFHIFSRGAIADARSLRCSTDRISKRRRSHSQYEDVSHKAAM